MSCDYISLLISNNKISCISEIEAKEACDWLRAAGFPQYAQLFEGKKTKKLLHTFTHNQRVEMLTLKGKGLTK